MVSRAWALAREARYRSKIPESLLLRDSARRLMQIHRSRSTSQPDVAVVALPHGFLLSSRRQKFGDREFIGECRASFLRNAAWPPSGLRRNVGLATSSKKVSDLAVNRR